MADFFSRFSVLIPFQSVEARACALALQEVHNAQGGKTQPCTTEPFYFGAEEQAAEADGTAPLWVSDQGCGNEESVIAFVQECARQKLCVGSRWSFVWSHDCNRPRLDAYGGGACVLDLETGERIASLDLAEIADAIANGKRDTVRIDVGMAATAHDVLCLEMARPSV